MPGFKPLVVFSAVLVLPSAPFDERSSLLLFSNLEQGFDPEVQRAENTRDRGQEKSYDTGPELIEWFADFTRNMVRPSSSGAKPRRI